INQQRKNKTQKYIFLNSERIIERILDLEFFQDSTNILFYVSYDNEVCTHQLIKNSLSFGKKVYVPLSERKTHTLTISKLFDYNDLIPGTFGILEPKKEKQHLVPINVLDLILVPGIGFDKKGNRLGQGGGYYDWLLSKTKATAIALAFEFQLVDLIPTEQHDQQVDIIVTEEQVIYCKKN
ncbi:MAG: 5-formyltetrahydrofolate cyclo-ligase, partial [Candidatus Thermoplasmatota archaeon]|nr:5-formyltetrahydrofolate cyclo-ligase [Candidatus Thermoplasmatota archaeon]